LNVDGRAYRTVWMDSGQVFLIDQNRLPFEFEVVTCASHQETAEAIRDMTVRGAPAIGVTAGYGLAQAFLEVGRDPWCHARDARACIEATRPTARDLFYATARVWQAAETNQSAPAEAAMEAAEALAEESIAACRRIGEFGEKLIPTGARVLTHCNAGWLACVDYGTATAPIYQAASTGNALHVWVDETRPRSQGSRLTAWELQKQGVSHRIIADNAAALLMSRGEVDLVIVGADRVARNGDVVNKVGTLEKALCAREFGIPFYVAAPSSTLDASVPTGRDVIIEERAEDELHYQTGPDASGQIHRIRVTSPGSPAFNPAFDVTPARLVTALITERGIVRPSEGPF
jgi:methylthioribose-1-phosphate isomerase